MTCAAVVGLELTSSLRDGSPGCGGSKSADAGVCPRAASQSGGRGGIASWETSRCCFPRAAPTRDDMERAGLRAPPKVSGCFLGGSLDFQDNPGQEERRRLPTIRSDCLPTASILYSASCPAHPESSGARARPRPRPSAGRQVSSTCPC